MGKKKRNGSVVDMLTAGICVVAMTVLMTSYLGSIQLLDKKEEISQTARKYILRMETVGYLTGADMALMEEELLRLGAKELDFTGSTISPVSYGSPILLVIRGKLSGQSVAIGGDLFDAAFAKKMYGF